MRVFKNREGHSLHKDIKLGSTVDVKYLEKVKDQRQSDIKKAGAKSAKRTKR
jgi:hypothetical protein